MNLIVPHQLRQSPQNKHSINSPSPWHKSILHFIIIYHLTQTPIQNLLVQFKSMFQQLYSPIRVWIKGISFPFKIGTNELNTHSSGNLFLKKITLNMFVKDFKHLSPPALKILSQPRGSNCFPDFHTIHCTPHLFNLNSPHCTLYLTSINAITPFIFNIHQLFHMLLSDFLSIIHTYFYHHTFIFNTSNPKNIFLLLNPLFGNSKHLTTITTRINLLHCISSFLIHNHIY